MKIKNKKLIRNINREQLSKLEKKSDIKMNVNIFT